MCIPPAELLIALRAEKRTLSPSGSGKIISKLVNPQGRQAADTIERLKARVSVILGEGQARRNWITAEQVLLESYIEEYVLSTEGADYEPTEFERELIRDALQGFVVEQDRLLCRHLRKASTPTKDR